MSENKNIVIQQNNRTDYDKFHPEVYDKNVNLSTENASVWGNTLEDALPNIDKRINETNTYIENVDGNTWKIGDIRITSKSNLGEKWLKADGNVYQISQYPELAKITEVQGFPFGSTVYAKSSIPGKSIEMGALDSTNLVNLDCANHVNGCFFRFKEYYNSSSEKYSLLIHYSLDKITWNSVKIEIMLTGAGYASETTLLKRIGYVNEYWYLNIVPNPSHHWFVFSKSLEFSNFTMELIEEKSTFSQGGPWSVSKSLIFFNNSYFIAVRNLSTILVCAFKKIDMSDIYSSRSWSTGIRDSGTRSYNYLIDFFSFENKAFIFYQNFYSSSSRTYYYFNFDVYNFNTNSGSTVYKVTKQSPVLLNSIYKTDSYICFDFDESVTTSGTNNRVLYSLGQSSGTLSTTPNDSPKLELSNGKFLRGLLNTGSVTWYVGDNFLMDNVQSYTENLTGTITSANSFINVEFEDGIGIYLSDNVDNSTSYILKYGGILPNSNIKSTSLTPINTFIKALD